MPVPAPSTPPTAAGVGAGRVTWPVVQGGLVGAAGGVLFGWDLGVTGGVSMDEAFLKVRDGERKGAGVAGGRASPKRNIGRAHARARLSPPLLDQSGRCTLATVAWRRDWGRQRAPKHRGRHQPHFPTDRPPPQTSPTSPTSPSSQRFFPAIAREAAAAKAAPSPWCKYDDHLLTLFTSSCFLAAAVTTLFAGPFTRSAGRRAAMVAAGVAFIVGIALCAGAVHVAMLVVGRLLVRCRGRRRRSRRRHQEVEREKKTIDPPFRRPNPRRLPPLQCGSNNPLGTNSLVDEFVTTRR